jgi:hypothetical protein
VFGMHDSLSFGPEELDAFPVIDDFAVTLADAGEGGQHIEFTSASRGRLAHFPEWDHADRDLRHFVPTDVPLGSADEPYFDRDDGWLIVIFVEGAWVYIAEGDDPNGSPNGSRFRVKAERYLQAWAALIELFNPITPLDDPS